MFLARTKAMVTSRAVLFSAFFALIALPLQQLADAPSGLTSIFSFGKTNVIKVLPHQKDRVAVAWFPKSHDQSPRLNPFFLRIDYKQNLLVWPIVFGNLTRSPPSGDSFSLLS